MPGSVLMNDEADAAFFFDTAFEGARHPHYGRFLRLRKSKVVELNWLNATTVGEETVVTVEFLPNGTGTDFKLSYAAFPDESLRKHHEDAWPIMLEQMDRKIGSSNPD